MPLSSKEEKKPGDSRHRTKIEGMQFKEAIELMREAKQLGVASLSVGEFSVSFEKAARPTAETQADDDALYRRWNLAKDMASPPAFTPEQYAEASQPVSDEAHQPAIRSIEDDPDVYARNSDAWANQTRLPQR